MFWIDVLVLEVSGRCFASFYPLIDEVWFQLQGKSRLLSSGLVKHPGCNGRQRLTCQYGAIFPTPMPPVSFFMKWRFFSVTARERISMNLIVIFRIRSWWFWHRDLFPLMCRFVTISYWNGDAFRQYGVVSDIAFPAHSSLYRLFAKPPTFYNSMKFFVCRFFVSQY